jgi:hypothetical protein
VPSHAGCLNQALLLYYTDLLSDHLFKEKKLPKVMDGGGFMPRGNCEYGDQAYLPPCIQIPMLEEVDMKRRGFIRSSISSGLVGATMLSGISDVLAAPEPESGKKKAQKRSLIMYASRTNNTTKVAEHFKSTLERNGWQCDTFRISQDGGPTAFPYIIKDYDLVCAGSGINLHTPYAELIAAIRTPRYGYDPLKVVPQMPGAQPAGKETSKMPAGGISPPAHGKIIFGPDSKKCISFVTYGGLEFGPWEAQPALDWINVEMAHLNIQPIGTFCCPGRFLPYDVPNGYYNDLTTRPNEKDLMRAELFMEQILEGIGERPAKTS